MAKNLFVNTTGLPIEKEMPSLIGMDLSGVGKEPLKLNIGKTISEFANKAQALKEQANATKLYNQLIDEEQAWKIEYLSDPNAFANKERRTEIAKSYNSLIERKKTIINGAKNNISAKQYSALEGQFKQQTYDSLFELQTKMNSAFVQETVEEMGVEKNALIIKCANTSNREEISNYLEILGKCFDAESSLGIDNTQQRVNTILSIEENYIDRRILNDIINSNDKQYAVTEKDGTPKLDLNGNYIMDSSKILRAVNKTRDYLLSKDGITNDAKKLAKSYSISEDDAYNYIYNARHKYFSVKGQNLQANLSSKSEIQKWQLFELEAKTNVEIAKKVNNVRELINKGASAPEIFAEIGDALDGTTCYYNQEVMQKFANVNNIDELNQQGSWIPVINSDIMDSIYSDIYNAKNDVQLKGAIDNLSMLQEKGGANNTYNYFAALQLQKLGINIGATRAMLGQNKDIDAQEAQKIFLNMQKSSSINFDNIDTSYKPSRYSFPIKFDNTDGLKYILANVKANPSIYLPSNLVQEFTGYTSEQERLDFLVKKYNDSGIVKQNLDNLQKKIDIINTVSDQKEHKIDTSNNSQLIKYVKDRISFTSKTTNASKLFKSGEGYKLFDVDVDGNLVSAFGYALDADNLSIDDLDAYNSILKDFLLQGRINFDTIYNYENGVIFKNEHNFKYFTKVIEDMIDEGKLNDINMIVSIPIMFNASKKINDYINSKIKED